MPTYIIVVETSTVGGGEELEAIKQGLVGLIGVLPPAGLIGLITHAGTGLTIYDLGSTVPHSITCWIAPPPHPIDVFALLAPTSFFRQVG